MPHLDAVAHGQGSAGVVLDDVRLALGRGPVHLLAILAVVVPGGPQDGEVQLRHRVRPHVRVPLGQVVHQHAPPLEAQEASVALVDEPVVVCRRHLLHTELQLIFEQCHWMWLRYGSYASFYHNLVSSECYGSFDPASALEEGT